MAVQDGASVTDETADQIFLSWSEVARAIRHYLYAEYHAPDGATFELIPKPTGLIVRLVKESVDAFEA